MTATKKVKIASSLVLDASVIINLLGSDHAGEVLAAIDVSFVVEERTLKEIRRHPISGRSHVDELNALMVAGLIRIVRMADEAYEIYLGLIDDASPSSLGDGESAAIAVAATLGHCVVLDDRKARRVFSERYPRNPLLSTIQLFVGAAENCSVVNAKFEKIVELALSNSRMGIPNEDKHFIVRD